MNDYRITIRSVIDGEANEIIAFGDMRREYGSTSVSFVDDDTKDYTNIVIGKDIVSIIKQGEMDAVLTLEKGKTISSALVTQYGEIPIDLETCGIDVGEWDDGVNLDLSYITDIAGERTKFAVTVRAERVGV